MKISGPRSAKFNKVRARAGLEIGQTFSIAEAMDAPDATVDSIASAASTVLDTIEQARDEAKGGVIRIGEVSRLVGLSRTEIYRRLDAGLEFPPPVELGGTGRRRRVGWHLSEVRAWLRNRARTVARN